MLQGCCNCERIVLVSGDVVTSCLKKTLLPQIYIHTLTPQCMSKCVFLIILTFACAAVGFVDVIMLRCILRIITVECRAAKDREKSTETSVYGVTSRR